MPLTPQRYLEHDALPQPPGSILEYWRILRRRNVEVLLLTLVGGLSAFLLTLPQTPLFQARALIEVQSLNENFLNLREVNPTTESGALAFPEYDVQTQIRVLQSRSLVERAGRSLDPQARRSAEIRRVAATLKVRGQPNTRVIEISGDAADPRLAADFVNTLTRELIEQNLESRWKTTQTTGEWLSRQMEGVRLKLEHSEGQLQDYAREAGLLFTSEKSNAAEERLRQLQEELSRAQADRFALQSKYELASASPPSDDTLRASEARLTDLRRELAQLTASFTAEHPKVKRVEAQIAAIETSLAAERAAALRRIRGDYESARRREALLAAGYSAQAQLVSRQAGEVAHYNLLKREVDTNRQLYDSMLQRVKEASVAAALRASNIRVIDQAQPPAVPYRPNPLHNTLAGMLIGGFSAVVFVITRDRTDRRLQEPGDASFFVGLPELGVIPNAHRVARRGTLPAPRLLGRLRRASGRAELTVWPRKPSALSESFRGAAASLLFGAPDRERARVLVISSAAPGEGKSTVTANLAMALAEIGGRVLVIDADLRKPGLHEAFGAENTEGLADLLRRKEPLLDPLDTLARPTAIPRLTLLAGGRASFAETALLYSTRLEEVLSLARACADTVLIDTPPMLAMADARVIARHADGVVLVARAGRTTRDSLRSAWRRFVEDGTKVAGVILNDWDPRRRSRNGSDHYADCYARYALEERN